MKVEITNELFISKTEIIFTYMITWNDLMERIEMKGIQTYTKFLGEKGRQVLELYISREDIPLLDLPLRS